MWKWVKIHKDILEDGISFTVNKYLVEVDDLDDFANHQLVML